MKRLTFITLGMLFACSDSSVTTEPDFGTLLGYATHVRFMAWTDDGTTLVYTHGSPSSGTLLLEQLRSFDVQANELHFLDNTPRLFNSLSLAGDKVIYQALNQDNSSGVYALDLSQQNPTPALVSDGHNPVVSPDGARVVVRLGKDSLGSIELVDSSITAFALTGGDALAFSPDAKSVLISNGNVLDLDSGLETPTPTALPETPRWIRWSSSGMWALTYKQVLPESYVLTNVLDGSSKDLYHPQSGETWGFTVSWTSDNKLGFLRSSTMGTSPLKHFVYVCDLNTSETIKVLDVTLRNGSTISERGIDSFAISPDGKYLAYAINNGIYIKSL